MRIPVGADPCWPAPTFEQVTGPTIPSGPVTGTGTDPVIKEIPLDPPIVRKGPRFATVAILLLALAIALAAASFWPIHRSSALYIAVGVALASGIAIGVLGALRRWPAWAVGAATIAAYLLLGVPAAVPGEAAFGVLPTVRGIGVAVRVSM